MSSDLKEVVEQYVKAAGEGDHETLAATYSPDFSHVWVADDGGQAELTGEQILFILKATAKTWRPRPARETKIHRAEIHRASNHAGELACEWGEVLVTRLRDLGAGWEPEFLTQIWRKMAGKWLLSREFVHRRRFATCTL